MLRGEQDLLAIYVSQISELLARGGWATGAVSDAAALAVNGWLLNFIDDHSRYVRRTYP